MGPERGDDFYKRGKRSFPPPIRSELRGKLLALSRGVLNALGVVRAPKDFGQVGNDVFIGNPGGGKISAWEPDTGMFIDWMNYAHNKTIELGTLWTLVSGGGAASSPQTLYFTTGLDMEQDGLFGALTPN